MQAKNTAALRNRLARLEAAAGPEVPAASVVTPPPARAAPSPTGTREERLTRLAQAMGGTDEELAAAIDGGLAPDEFAVLLLDGNAVDRTVARILDDGVAKASAA